MWATLRGAAVVLPQMLKYQLVTKLLMAVVISPLFGLTSALLVAHDGAITNSNLVPFMLSPRGWGFLVLILGLVTVGLLVELGGFITISARSWQGEPETGYRRILRHSFSRLKNLAGPAALFIVAYLALVIPLTGVGAGLSFMGVVRIPNFISSFIHDSPGYLTAYIALGVVLAVVSVLCSYTFHRIVLANERVGQALRGSARWVLAHWRLHLRRVVLPSMLIGAGVLVVLALWWLVIFGLLSRFGAESLGMRILLVSLLLLQQFAFAVGAMLLVPLQVHLLTGAYLASEPGAEVASLVPVLPPKGKRSLADRIVDHPWRTGAVVLLGIAALGSLGGAFFDPVFRNTADPLVVAHRAGGFAAPENSMSGLRAAIAQGADMVEIDVQRTQDGHYVLNHDDTFARAAGVRKKSSDLTWTEIQRLDISKARDGSERVPELGPFLEAARGHVKVLIELKGATADEKMVDDVVALVDRLGMRADVVLITLDYRLVTYIERVHPAVDSGFLYFLSVGDVSALAADYIMLEEGEATQDRVDALGIAGKRPIVWTVNDEASIERALRVGVYGIITDNVQLLHSEIAHRAEETPTDILRRAFLALGRE